MTRFKIGQKLLLLLLAVSLGPLVVASIFLVISAEGKLRADAIAEQSITATSAASSVDNFLAEKTNILIFQSQTSSIRSFDIPDASLNLAAMVKQDRDIERVALVNMAGMEQVVVNQAGLVAVHHDVSQSDSFKAATYLAGKEYVGPVVYTNGQPSITIAVPLIKFTSGQDLSHLSTAEFGTYRSPSDITGVLTADFSLANLWQSVLANKIGKDGYAYVVDDRGNLIAHPDTNFLAQNHDMSHVPAVADFLAGKTGARESKSEKGVSVLAQYKTISRTSWGVIVEEPTATVYSSVNSFYRFGAIILLSVTVIVLVVSLVFRRRLLTPIQMMAAGAMRIGRGDFTYKIDAKANDELGDLAQNFNSMGDSLAAFFQNLQQQNESLRTERQKQSSILQSVSDGIIAINKDQEIILVNPPAAALMGKTVETITGAPLQAAFPVMHGDTPFTLNLSQTGSFHYEDLLLTINDKVSYLELVVVVAGGISDIAAIITVHDVTNSRELETMKLDFVAIAAHELRTPLTVVRGYLDLITSSPEMNKLTVMNIEYLQRTRSGVTQLGELINNILNVSRIERSSLQISVAKIDLAMVLKQATDQQRVTAEIRHQTLTYDRPVTKLYVMADESAITEVVNNLVSNAIKYTPENGHITVQLTSVDGYARVDITDNGKGIPEASRSRLFTKFYRVENSMTTGNRGTGLGLYICKSIITMHHGIIDVRSKLGEGSTFFFTLPLYDTAKHQEVTTQTKELGGIHGWFPKRSDR